MSGLLAPLRGTVLCLGCGYGTLETVLAAANPHLDFLASDINAERIAVAQKSVHGLSNIQFSVTDATEGLPPGDYDNALLSDVLHHLPGGAQEPLLSALWGRVRPGGVLLVKDLDVQPRWKYWWNYLHDRVVAGLPLTYLPPATYQGVLGGLGAAVTTVRPRTRLPYAHYAMLARKEPVAA
ncbi:class I SAM-dependent methyltransferase [Modestobacter sp. NPDC049651]|uniref:class I SAM-dependent methyltransferase n=1 Tax=unclassified Modestobacter TaxID=2643866 RepID=UPI0034041A3A